MTIRAAVPAKSPPPARNTEGRQQILQAASDIFARQGFYAATIREIGRASGLSSTAIYYHFEDKDALLLAVCEPVGLELRRRLESLEQLPLTPVAHVLATLEAAGEWALRNWQTYDLLLLTDLGTRHSPKVWAYGRELEALCVSVLERSVRKLLVASSEGDRDAEVMALALWAATNGVIGLCLRSGRAKVLAELLPKTVEPILHDLMDARDVEPPLPRRVDTDVLH